MQTEKKTKLPYKLLDSDFYQGDLEAFIDLSDRGGAAAAAVDMVVSIDFGHGECMCWKRYKSSPSSWSEDILQFDSAKNNKIMTVLRYGDDGSVTIGREVISDELIAKGGVMHSYFKVPPRDWTDDLANGKKYGDAIRDYLTELWKRVLLYDQGREETSIKKALKDGRLLVAMGCPASSDWTDPEPARKLRDLIGSITGCDKVVIMPEPKAALMSPIANAGKASDAWKKRLTELMTTGHGVCIYDLGSSTIDFTYVRMGRLLITSSIRLGGSDLDKGMLKKVENDWKADSDWVLSKDPNMRDEYSLRLRLAKEECYRGIRQAVLLQCEGRNDKTETSDEPIVITPKFMEAVVNAPIDGGASWYQRVLKFFEDTHADVVTNLGSELDKSGFNGLIILTGGTSQVTEVRQICQQVWNATEEKPFEGNSRVDQKPHTVYTILPDPSSSVAMGLAFAKSTECEAAAKMPVIRSELLSLYNGAYQQYILNLSQYCALSVYKCFEIAAKKLDDGNEHMIDDIVNATMKNIGEFGCFSDDYMQKIMGTLLGTGDANGKLAVCQKSIIDKVNVLSQDIYGGQLNGRIALPPMNLSGDVRYYLSGAVSSVVVDKITDKIMNSIFGYLAVLDAVLWIFRNYGEPTLIDKQKQKPLTTKQIKKVVEKLSEKKDPIVKRAAKSVKSLLTDMDPAEMKDPYFRMLDAQLEVALGKVLFLVYDNTDCK